MKKRVLAAVGATGALLCATVALAVGGGAEDPLVSKSYVDGTYTTQMVEQAETAVEQRHDALYADAEAGLKAKQEGYLAGLGGSASGGSYQAAFSDIRVKEGDTIQVTAGSGFLLLAGSGDLSCTGKKTIDLSNGWEKGSGALTQGRRYLVMEDTVATITVTSPTAVVSLEGWHTLTESGKTDYNALADALRVLGLFRGSDTGYGSGYDLELPPTRIQGLIMFLRLIGEEQAALATTAACPFTDVPAWCQSYVAYAYEKGYTKGMDEAAKLFGTNDTLTAGQYVTFLLRALGYSESGETPDFTWDTALQRGVELGVLTAGERQLLEGGDFLRAQVVYLSYFALDAREKDGTATLQERLVAAGILDQAVVATVRAGVDVDRL